MNNFRLHFSLKKEMELDDVIKELTDLKHRYKGGKLLIRDIKETAYLGFELKRKYTDQEILEIEKKRGAYWREKVARRKKHLERIVGHKRMSAYSYSSKIVNLKMVEKYEKKIERIIFYQKSLIKINKLLRKINKKEIVDTEKIIKELDSCS